MSGLRRLLAAPVLEDEAQTQQAFKLHVILWALVVVPVPYVLLTAIVAPASTGRAGVEAAAGEAANAFHAQPEAGGRDAGQKRRRPSGSAATVRRAR